jgi:hypothetical protein
MELVGLVVAAVGVVGNLAMRILEYRLKRRTNPPEQS